MKRTILAWGPAALWALVLFLLSELQDAPAVVASLLDVSDKVLHFAMYVVLGSFLAWARHVSGVEVRHVFLLALGAAYGVADEWHQSFVPGRDPDVWDWFADVAGVAVGYLVTRVLLETLSSPRTPNHAEGE